MRKSFIPDVRWMPTSSSCVVIRKPLERTRKEITNMKKFLIIAISALLLVAITAIGTYHYVLNNYHLVIDNTDAYITIFDKTEYFVFDEVAPGKVIGIATYVEY